MSRQPDARHRVPDGVSLATVEALGSMSEALETVERARGALYDFHQLTGHADLLLDDAVRGLADAGHGDWAEELRHRLVGRNVVADRWSFEIVEDYDDGYVAAFRELEQRMRDALVEGRRHLHEARMKEQRRTGKGMSSGTEQA